MKQSSGRFQRQHFTGFQGAIGPGVLPIVEQRDFPDRVAKDPRAIRGASQRQFAREGHLLIEWHVRKGRASHPGGLNPPSVARFGIAPGLRGVEIRADITRIPRGFLFELHSIKAADGILSAALNQHPFQVVAIPVQRQFKKVRALKAVLDGVALVLPVQQIRGSEDMVLAVPIKHHYPMIAGDMPEHLRIAFRADQYWIFFRAIP